MTTNLERIRQMNSEELAEWIYNDRDVCLCCVLETKECNTICITYIREWLEQESEE